MHLLLQISSFEIVIVILGSSIQTGQLTRTQTSYLSKEILWGYRFSRCLEYNVQKLEYVINRKAFDGTVPIDTPLCSASTLHNLQMEIRLNHRRKSLDGLDQTEFDTNITWPESVISSCCKINALFVINQQFEILLDDLKLNAIEGIYMRYNYIITL